MKILFLHEVSYKGKPIFEMHEFPEHMSSKGHEVFFLDYREEKSGQGFSVQREVIKGRVLSGARVNLITLAPNIKGLLGRLITALLFPIIFMRELRRLNPDIVVCYAVPTMGWQAVIISRFARIPFVFRALDVSHRIRKTVAWPAVLIAEVVTYSLANFVTANNAALLRYCRKLGARSSRSCVTLPPLDHANFSQTRDRGPSKGQWKSESKNSVILYMGSFFYFSGLKQVLESVPSLPSNTEFWLIGGGEQEMLLKGTVENLRLHDQVDFKGFVDYKLLMDYFATADVAINPMERSVVSNLALPNKVLQYMAASVPVVSTRLDGLEKTLGTAPGLFFVDKPEQIMEKVKEILQRSDLSQLGEQNAQYVRRKFSLQESVDSFEMVLVRARAGQYE